MNKIIDCHLHDYIEIACLFGYQLRLELINQSAIEGQAINTETSADKREWLVLDIEGRREKVDLGEIRIMWAIAPNPHFDKVEFPA